MEASQDQRKNAASLQAMQLVNSGVNPLEVIEKLQSQGMSEAEAKEAVRMALLEKHRGTFEQVGSIWGLLKVGVPLILLATFVLSMFLSIIIGALVGLVGGTIVLVMMAKKRLGK